MAALTDHGVPLSTVSCPNSCVVAPLMDFRGRCDVGWRWVRLAHGASEWLDRTLPRHRHSEAYFTLFFLFIRARARKSKDLRYFSYFFFDNGIKKSLFPWLFHTFFPPFSGSILVWDELESKLLDKKSKLWKFRWFFFSFSCVLKCQLWGFGVFSLKSLHNFDVS